MDFQFLQNQTSKKWVVLAPRRAKRPDVAKGVEPVCPFCLGKEKDEQEVYRVSLGQKSEIESNDQNPNVQNSSDSNWLVRVIPNKFPFAEVHEVIIHSPDHHKNFDELPIDQVRLILETYRHRYNEHAHKGQVYIFHNRGAMGGESLPHPHSQLAVVPFEVKMDIPRLKVEQVEKVAKVESGSSTFSTQYFVLTCPLTSQWPDEVWIAPKNRGKAFGEITNEEVFDLAKTLKRLIQIFDIRHGHEFPFNFYIYPGEDWYLRIIPRLKTLGGFELGTNIYVNTQDPKETMEFIREHFNEPDIEKIKSQHQAEYQRRV